MGFNVEEYISERKKLVDRMLSELFKDTSDSITTLDESMRYSILAGGKRLRPVLCIASAEAVGGRAEDVLPVACAIEMIHTYSLIHDDLPAMDDDTLRRGVPTNHNVFGEAVAILAGDALLTDAFFVIAQSEISPYLVVDVIREISRAAGSKGMVRGQALDLALEGKEVSIETVERMHYLKTGALIEASVVSGGKVGGATGDQILQLRSYSRNLGIAFQIIDDVLDIEGGEDIGKSRGSDIRRKKATYPGIVGIKKAKDKALELTLKAVSCLKDFDEKAEPLREIAFYLGGRRY
ncbi:MAG: farnesyl-diphosphate synthase [Deltaproteobacteria bacterium]|jgi:geranylgeranyl diphosphate synthase type II|nr:MAG: farnesyl-diphosphate synthase [Deltaproteobacteria bacterium]